MMNNPDNTTWDVAVIGGGPAGMMSAGTAAQHGARVILLEKNNTLGKKLLIRFLPPHFLKEQKYAYLMSCH